MFDEDKFVQDDIDMDKLLLIKLQLNVKLGFKCISLGNTILKNPPLWIWFWILKDKVKDAGVYVNSESAETLGFVIEPATNVIVFVCWVVADK